MATATVPEGASTLHVLVHGGTYSSWYWHPTCEPEIYSYVLAAARRGRATLNVDLLGAGASERPPSDELGMRTHVGAVAQIVRTARERGVAGRRWEHVVLVGHSLGSGVIVDYVDRDEHDGLVDAAVITGFTRHRDPAAGGLRTLNQPALDDPKFVGDSYAGYTTLPAGSRPFFYYLPTTSPRMLLEDERHRSVVSLRDLQDFARDWESTPSHTTVPILVAAGREDFTFRWTSETAFAMDQRVYYPNARMFDTLVVPETGHNIGLHGHGPQATESILDWVEATVQ